jgi:hypothetical protein
MQPQVSDNARGFLFALFKSRFEISAPGLPEKVAGDNQKERKVNIRKRTGYSPMRPRFRR